MEACSFLNEIQKQEIEELIICCEKTDHTCQEVYLGNDFTPYKDMNLFFLEKEETLSGVLVIFTDNRTSAEIMAWVHPEKRRKGIFTKLFSEARKELERYGYKKLLFKTEKACEGGEKAAASYPVTFSHREYHMVADVGACRPGKRIPGFCLKKAEEADLMNLAGILRRAFDDEEFDTEESVKATFQNPKAILFAAFFEEQLIGCVSVDLGGRRNYLYALCIAPEYQGKGYGREMLWSVKEILGVHDTKQVTLDVDEQNTAALPLYESCGFVKASQLVYYEMKL